MDATRDIRVLGLRAGYGKEGFAWTAKRRAVVDGLDCTFRAGEITAIVGANGAGKSTLLRAVVDPCRRFGGSVLCDGKELETGQVAYVPQNPAATLAPWSTGYDEVALALRIRGVPAAQRRAAADRLCADLGIAVPLERNVQEMSGGQRVKVAILRALAVPGHRLLALDEPFEGLDRDARAAVMDVILRVRAQGVPVILTSHREQDLHELGARIVRMEGRPVSRLVETRAPSSENGLRQAEKQLPETADDGWDAAADVAEKRREPFGQALVPGLAGLAAGTLVWWALALIVGNPGLLPGPFPVAAAAARLLWDPELFPHLAATMARALGCWLLANAVAVPAGILLGYCQRIYRMAAPWLAVGRSAPVFVLVAPVAGLLPNLPEAQRALLIFGTVFLISAQAVSATAAMIPRRRDDLAWLYGASLWFRLRNVVLFESAGGVFSTLEVTLPISIIVTFVVESFLIPGSGLSLYVFNRLYDPDLSVLFAHVLLPGLVAALGMALLRRAGSAFRYDL